MRFSAKTEYACIAMLELAASRSTGEPVRIRNISARHEIPQRFLVQILLQLKGAGLVASTRGASGGYQLTRDPTEITLREVVEVIEGPPDFTPASKAVNSPAVQVLSSVWREITEQEQDWLAGLSLSDLVERTKDSASSMYYI
jgi:Rrf2 family protein